jgi:hypothetical protein
MMYVVRARRALPTLLRAVGTAQSAHDQPLSVRRAVVLLLSSVVRPEPPQVHRMRFFCRYARAAADYISKCGVANGATFVVYCFEGTHSGAECLQPVQINRH